MSNQGYVDALRVWVEDHLGQRSVGELRRVRENGAAYQSHVSFSYDAGMLDQDAISLTMPITDETIEMPVAGMHHILHPIFDQNLPEGALRRMLETRLSKVLPDVGDFELLTLLAQSNVALGRIGRVSITLIGEKPGNVVADELDYTSILASREGLALMDDLIVRYGLNSAVSGMQPKIIGAVGDGERRTIKATSAIIKASSGEYPWLALNEFFCMEAVRACGLPCPEFRLSADCELLVVDRFDVLDDGYSLGFEDMCTLTGRTSNQRYEGSYEDVAATLEQHLDEAGRHAALSLFFRAVVLNAAIGNGDAHLKNFGILYPDPTSTVILAPIYDVVCTTTYLRDDTLALDLGGSRQFPDQMRLVNFGRDVCRLNDQDIATSFLAVLQAIKTMGAKLQQYSAENAEFSRRCGQGMLRALAQGVRYSLAFDPAKILIDPVRA